MDNIESALQLSDEILTGIETESLKLSAIALRCLRLARLLFDDPAIEWFQRETSGYPRTSENMIDDYSFRVACEHGRELPRNKDGRPQIFAQLADELEVQIEANQKAIGTLTTQGVSVAGQYSVIAMRELSDKVNQQGDTLVKSINECQHRLAILRGKYYAYALSVNLELRFSQRAEDVFRSYRLSVDKRLAKLAPESLKRLDAAYERITETNSESWSQAITSCRRVLQEVADALFTETRDKTYTTKSGKVLDVAGDHYLNRLFATIDTLASSPTARRLIGSNASYIVDWVDNLHDMLNRGVHDLDDKITYSEARFSVLHTYMLLGDIASLVLGEDN